MAIKQYFATLLQMIQDAKLYFSAFCCSHLYPASQTLSVMFHFPENTSETTLVKVQLRFEKHLWFLHRIMDKEAGIFVNPSWKQIETRQYQNYFQKHCRKQGRSNVSNRVCRFQMALPFSVQALKVIFSFLYWLAEHCHMHGELLWQEGSATGRSCVLRDVLDSRFALRVIQPRVSSRHDITDTFLWHPLVTNLIAN